MIPPPSVASMSRATLPLSLALMSLMSLAAAPVRCARPAASEAPSVSQGVRSTAAHAGPAMPVPAPHIAVVACDRYGYRRVNDGPTTLIVHAGNAPWEYSLADATRVWWSDEKGGRRPGWIVRRRHGGRIGRPSGGRCRRGRPCPAAAGSPADGAAGHGAGGVAASGMGVEVVEDGTGGGRGTGPETWYRVVTRSVSGMGQVVACDPK